MSKESLKYISVFIPTYNGDKYLASTIEAILNQKLPTGYELELLITDSGSKDTTLDIIKTYGSQVTLTQIPNAEFGHGKTRQAAARQAKGEFILFLSQDATPTDNSWATNMIEPFYISDKVGCVFGRQHARPNAAAPIKREVNGVFGSIVASDAVSVYRSNSLVTNQLLTPPNTFFSDVNSAVRRELLIGDVPFRDVSYAEDQALAKDMQENGYLKAYAPLGQVWHSNEYTYKEYFYRKFDEYIGLQESLSAPMKPELRSLLLGWVRPTIADWKFIRRDRDYRPKSKLAWFVRSPLYNIALQLGKYRAAQSLNDPAKRERYSLEAGRKSK